MEDLIEAGGITETDLLNRNVAKHDPALDSTGKQPEALYLAHLASLMPHEKAYYQEKWWNDPSSTELFVRSRFTPVPNSPNLETLKKYCFPLLCPHFPPEC